MLSWVPDPGTITLILAGVLVASAIPAMFIFSSWLSRRRVARQAGLPAGAGALGYSPYAGAIWSGRIFWRGLHFVLIATKYIFLITLTVAILSHGIIWGAWAGKDIQKTIECKCLNPQNSPPLPRDFVRLQNTAGDLLSGRIDLTKTSYFSKIKELGWEILF